MKTIHQVLYFSISQVLSLTVVMVLLPTPASGATTLGLDDDGLFSLVMDQRTGQVTFDTSGLSFVAFQIESLTSSLRPDNAIDPSTPNFANIGNNSTRIGRRLTNQTDILYEDGDPLGSIIIPTLELPTLLLDLTIRYQPTAESLFLNGDLVYIPNDDPTPTNMPPQIFQISPNVLDPSGGGFFASVSDDNLPNGELNVIWDFDGDGFDDGVGSTFLSFDDPVSTFGRTGKHTILLKADDGELFSIASHTFTIIPEPVTTLLLSLHFPFLLCRRRCRHKSQATTH